MKKQKFETIEYVYGRNTVIEFFKNKQAVKKVYITEKTLNSNKVFADIYKRYKTQAEIVEIKFLDKITKSANHQGIVVETEPFKYKSLEEVILKNESKNAFLLVLDHLQDPHNFGAIIRTAVASGVDAIVTSKDRSASVNATVRKVSAGAVDYIDIVSVSNIANALKKLKDNKFWITGTKLSDNSIDYRKIDVDCSLALVIGNESSGITNVVSKECDYLVKIPMEQNFDSLNASVSAGILMYEIYSKRNPL